MFPFLQDHQINVVGLTEELVSSCDDVLNTIKMGDGKEISQAYEIHGTLIIQYTFTQEYQIP